MIFISNLISKISNLKVRFFSDYRVVNFIRFVKTDGTVQRIRDWSGKIHPYLYEHFFYLASRFVIGLIIFLSFYGFFWQEPSDFPTYYITTVSSGESLVEIADNL